MTSREIPSLLRLLDDENGFIRMLARKALTCIGTPAVSELINALSQEDPQLRWQLIKTLEEIHDQDAIPHLVKCLMDQNAGVRWAASDALISFRTAAIPSLLDALLRDIDSIWLRTGAHHILHVLKERGRLNDTELAVFDALEGVKPPVEVPWAAEKALEYLRKNKR